MLGVDESGMDYECLSNWNLRGSAPHVLLLPPWNLSSFSPSFVDDIPVGYRYGSYLLTSAREMHGSVKKKRGKDKIEEIGLKYSGWRERSELIFNFCPPPPPPPQITTSKGKRIKEVAAAVGVGVDGKKSVFTRQICGGLVGSCTREEAGRVTTTWLRQMAERLPAMSQSEKVIIRQPWCVVAPSYSLPRPR